MTALICGSFAYDSIMVFEDRFKNHILPDKIHMLNVAFFVPTMRREFGGCAGNIAYNFKLLGGDGLPMGTVGTDFDSYAEWMVKTGVDARYVKTVDGHYTAQAYITTDLDDNQITAFHPGAMQEAHSQAVPTDGSISLGIVSPDGRDAMIDHASQFAAAGIPFIFDPGQGLPMFDGDDLKRFVEQATYVTVNDYEFSLLSERTGWSAEEIAQQVEALIVTKGGEGSSIYANGETLEIPAAPVTDIKDPTGCGDSFRAGLLKGLQAGWSWQQTGRVASLMGAIKIESAGTQNHHFSLDEFRNRYQAAFSESADFIK
jgi:adenosine kinase